MLAGIAEKNSEHPLGEAIVEHAKLKKISLPEPEKFESITGKGVIAFYNKKKILLGNVALLKENKIDFKKFEEKISVLENDGKTVMLLAVNGGLAGIIAVADTLKEHSVEAVNALQAMGKQVIMITGDNERTAKAIAKKAGIESVLANVLPQEKAAKIKELQRQGKVVAAVGDGINDAPMLAQAELGIAIGAGTDVALETGSIVLIKNDLRDVIKAIELSTYTLKKIKQNLFWAFIYNIVLIPSAALGLLNPVLAALAMALSSVSVVGNSLLMRRYKAKI